MLALKIDLVEYAGRYKREAARQAGLANVLLEMVTPMQAAVALDMMEAADPGYTIALQQEIDGWVERFNELSVRYQRLATELSVQKVGAPLQTPDLNHRIRDQRKEIRALTKERDYYRDIARKIVGRGIDEHLSLAELPPKPVIIERRRRVRIHHD